MTITQSKHFDTIESLVADASRPSSWAKYNQNSRDRGQADFYGTASFEGAVTLARSGWHDGVAKMTRNVSALAASNSVARTASFTYDVAGAYPVPAMAAAGLPDCMVAFAPVQERARPIVRLLVTVAVASMMTSERFTNYGAALVSIIDALESNDCRVELTVAACSRPSSSRTEKALYTVRVKESHDPVDLDRLAFCLSHVAFFRRLFFGVYEANAPEFFRSDNRRSGTPERDEVESGVVIIPSAMSLDDGVLDSPASAFEALLPIVSKLLTDHDATIPPLIFDRS